MFFHILYILYSLNIFFYCSSISMHRTQFLQHFVSKCINIYSMSQDWACVLFKRMQRSCVLYKRMWRSFRSFAFFIKERGVLCVLLLSFQKNAAFFCILYKRMRRSLRSFAFFIKECGVLCVLLRSL